jgi:thiol-disulfide isomerase/thioredoxin
MHMTRTIWVPAGIALVTVLAAGIFIGSRITLQASADLVDLSALPEDLREQHRHEAFLEMEAQNYAMAKEIMAQQEAERAKRPRKTLPDGIKSVPLGRMYEPGPDIHWPENVSGEIAQALEDARDGWVILNYWASWCAPCVHELPDMGAAVPLYANKGVTLIAVNTDPMQKDTTESAEKLFAEKGVENLVPYIADKSGVDALLAASGQSIADMSLPTSIIYAPGGVPYATFSGADTKAETVWTADATLQFLYQLVAQN